MAAPEIGSQDMVCQTYIRSTIHSRSNETWAWFQTGHWCNSIFYDNCSRSYTEPSSGTGYELNEPFRKPIGSVRHPVGSLFEETRHGDTPMKTAQILLLLLSTIMAGMAYADPQKPRLKFVTDDNFVPYAFVENGVIKGIDCDIVMEMGRRMGVAIQIELVPWKRLLMMTKNGACDGSFSLFKTREREGYGIFAFPVPLHQSTYSVFTRFGGEFPFRGIWDLYGKRLAKNRGFSISDDFDDAVKREKFQVEEVESVVSSIKMLMAGRIDGFVGNLHTTIYHLRKMGLYDRIVRLLRPAAEDRNCYLVLSRKGPAPDKNLLLEKINNTLIRMKMDGTIRRITDKYLQPESAGQTNGRLPFLLRGGRS